MPAFEQKDNSGALFKNDEKQADTHADYKGTIRVAGTDYWINAWLKTSKKGAKFMSLSVTAKQRASKPERPAPQDFQDDDIPF